jgi:hypothetical protein
MAAKMVKKHDHRRNKRTLEFSEGDVVSVRLPRIDRGSTEFPRVPGVVNRVTGSKDIMYEIITEHGILNDKYRACDLEEYHGELTIDKAK